ncbi:GatB/YqeY domain-containing protein [Patescibacteria group bacterium]|nr:GatB/YqeY domain-containing protein [Patescibacteria group bacterium]
MNLREKIQIDLKKTLKEKRNITVGTLRMLNAAIINREKEKRYKLTKEEKELTEEELIEESKLTNEEIIEVISSEIKKRKEAIFEFEKGKRSDLVEKEKKEIGVLQKYLPEQLSEKEIKNMAGKIIAALQASLSPRSTQGEAGAPSEREKVGIRDMGKVMGVLMPKIKGRAEGSKVSKIVKELLEKWKET